MTSTVLSEISDDTVDIFFLNEMVKPLPGRPIAIYAKSKIDRGNERRFYCTMLKSRSFAFYHRTANVGVEREYKSDNIINVF